MALELQNSHFGLHKPQKTVRTFHFKSILTGKLER